MDEKKIYKILQDWFPELHNRKLPEKDSRGEFSTFLQWIHPEKMANRYRAYLMTVVADSPFEHELEKCALLQNRGLDLLPVHTQIRERVNPLFAHYEKHKAVIGKYYNVMDQAFDIVFEEIVKLLECYNMDLLIIYAEKYHWIAVPEDAEKIEKFCKLFNKQFADLDVSIEHYALFDCSRST